MAITQRREKPQAEVRPCPSWGAMNLAHLLAKQALNDPDALLATLPDGVCMTYQQAQAKVDLLANRLDSLGLGAGDCLLLRQGRRIEGALLIIAAALRGLNVVVVPETMSAREACQGAASLVPRLLVDAGTMQGDGDEVPRAMEMAAGLFTVRLVAGFGAVGDGIIDLLDRGDGAAAQPVARQPEGARGGLVHMLGSGAKGGVERITRTQAQLLTQGLACAMALKLSAKSALGTPYDPAGSTGLLCAFIPALIVGSRLDLFNALAPDLTNQIDGWMGEVACALSLLPLALAQQEDAAGDRMHRRAWITHPAKLATSTIRLHETVIIDLNAHAYVPAEIFEDGAGGLPAGPIHIAGAQGASLQFGVLSIHAKAADNRATGSLMTGEILLEGPLGAGGQILANAPVRTGIEARLVDGPDGRPSLVPTAGDPGVRVGAQPVSLTAINRCLGLTGRWQDAAAFAVTDPVLGQRVEVAVEPRGAKASALGLDLPTLENVCAMLKESGISDFALPTKLHLVRAVVRSSKGEVLADALAPYPTHAPPNPTDADASVRDDDANDEAETSRAARHAAA